MIKELAHTIFVFKKKSIVLVNYLTVNKYTYKQLITKGLKAVVLLMWVELI